MNESGGMTPEAMRAAMQSAALDTQETAERAFMVYGPPSYFAPPANAEKQLFRLPAADTQTVSAPAKWRCGNCGAEQQGRFCRECGTAKPVPAADVNIRAWRADDLPQMLAVWNAVVEAGDAFPQEELLTPETGAAFFAQQSYTAVAEQDGRILGLYILHPNNVGRCGHICNASYAVSADSRGQHIGERLVLDSLEQGKAHGFRILQFNAVVESNLHARHLYERLGFRQLGTVEGGFRMKNGEYANICPYYKSLL